MKTSRYGDIAFLQLAIRNEELMALMYDVFRVKVPCSKDFWEILRKEELMHAEKLGWLLAEIKAGKAALCPDRPASSLVKASVDSLESKVKTWRNWGIDKSDAYQFALLMEGGIIEDRFFQPCEGDSEVAKEILYEMKAGCNTHFQRLREEYQKNDPSAGFFKHLRAKFRSLFKSD